jgi:hypothetical protein
MNGPLPPPLTWVFTAQVTVAPVRELGPISTGRRRIIPILGGTVAGPRLTGEVLDGGADWQILRPDGTADLVARYMLRADDGTLISVVNRGLRRGAPAVLARLAAGEAVAADEYYFRASPMFEAPPGPHAWLMDHVFVATGERRAGRVVITVFALG